MGLRVAVAGASGYAGGEILRLLLAHPEFEIGAVTAHSNAGETVGSVHPHLAELAERVFAPTEVASLEGHDIVFVALPHGQSGDLTDALGDSAIVIDCGADHRLESAQDWADFYGGDFHEPWTYGLPELPRADGDEPQRDRLAAARRIAVPGCNVIATTLAASPGLSSGVALADDIVAVLAVGPSGAGRALKPHLLASEMLGSASAYAVAGAHRHNPEIVQNLSRIAPGNVRISFTPVLVPMARGILATVTAPLADGIDPATVRDAWVRAYAEEPFVRVLPAGEFPRVSDVVGSNTASIGVGVDERAGRVVAVCAIDNLVKGTAGSAIQSANLATGLPEETGLPKNGVAP